MYSWVASAIKLRKDECGATNVITRTYATRFSHTARRCSGVISSLTGARSIEGGAGRISKNDRGGTLAEPEGAVEVEAMGVIGTVGRAGLLRELPE